MVDCILALTTDIWNTGCVPQQWKDGNMVNILSISIRRRVTEQCVVTASELHCYQPPERCYTSARQNLSALLRHIFLLSILEDIVFFFM